MTDLLKNTIFKLLFCLPMQVKRKAELSLLIVSRHTAPNDKVQIDCGRGPGILNVHEIADLSYHLSSDLLL